jgi:hypothetical protein
MDSWKGYRELYCLGANDVEVRVGTMLAWRDDANDEVDTWAIWTVSKSYETPYDKPLLMRGVEGWPESLDDALSDSALRDTAEWVTSSLPNGAAGATRYVGRYRVYRVNAANLLPVDPPPPP